jgi:hypothetical protein
MAKQVKVTDYYDGKHLVAVEVGKSFRENKIIYRIFENGEDISYDFAKRLKLTTYHKGIYSTYIDRIKLYVSEFWHLDDLRERYFNDTGKY